jgi:hypothetical protein
MQWFENLALIFLNVLLFSMADVKQTVFSIQKIRIAEKALPSIVPIA